MCTPYEFNLTSLLRTTCTTIIYFSFFCSLVCALSLSLILLLILFSFYSHSIYIFIRSSKAIAVVTKAACFCMPENNANACILLTIATNERGERESKPTSNNIYVCKEKRQVHDKSKE